jgi:hypothetical protein
VWQSKQCFKITIYRINVEKDVYKPIFVNGHFTYAWQKHMTLEDYVINCCDMDVETDDFLKLTYGNRTAKDVAAFLCHHNSPFFCEIKKNRNIFSFRNGIYYINKAIFIPYEECGEKLAALKQDLENVSRSNRKSEEIITDIVACNYINLEFQDWKKETNITPRSVPAVLSEMQEGKSKDDLIKDWNEKESKRKWISSKGFDIQTPAFDSILDSQKFSKSVKWWIYALTGMALYDGGEFDNWQIAILILGFAGTGKSTWLRMIRELYQLEDFGILSNNVEKQWALSSIVNKYVVVGYEVKDVLLFRFF